VARGSVRINASGRKIRKGKERRIVWKGRIVSEQKKTMMTRRRNEVISGINGIYLRTMLGMACNSGTFRKAINHECFCSKEIVSTTPQ
jgi:hypothetical protein